MNLEKFMKFTGNPDAYSAADVARLELMTEDELSDYQHEIETDSGNLSDWDHIRALMTFKDKNFEQQQEIDRLKYWETDGKRENEELREKINYFRKAISAEIASRNHVYMSEYEKGVMNGLVVAIGIVNK